MSTPRATLRLQFNRGFTLDDAIPLVDYFAALGLSHVYASPLMKARPDSPHGYDIVDHGTINPELGGEPALERLVAALRGRGMGLVMDLVPNHMAVGGADNAWWLDLLEWGRQSRYAAYFDIDWTPRDRQRRGRILAPFLGDTYGNCLAGGDIRLRFDAATGKFFIAYFGHRFPLQPASYALVVPERARRHGLHLGTDPAPEQAAQLFADLATGGERGKAEMEEIAGHFDPASAPGRLKLHTLLEQQHYRLCWWRVAGDEINWRRFFDINGLAGLRVELPEVFEATTRCAVDLYARGLIDGLRIDHVDGLADPRQYCRKLRRQLRAVEMRRPSDAPPGPAYLVVEKILQEGEALQPDWLVDGTTGYDFMEDVGALLHDGTGEEALSRLWQDLSGESSFSQVMREAKREVLATSFRGDLSRLVSILYRFARSRVEFRDLTYDALERTTTALLLNLPVYRLYAGRFGYSPADTALLQDTVRSAEGSVRRVERQTLLTVGNWLGAEPFRTEPPGAARRARIAAAARFQQLSGPLTAKGVEDTAFYRYGRLLSRNEVGSNPASLSLSVRAFHERAAKRARQFPAAMLATATHDHKRGEDARARLAVLSETGEDWAGAVRKWMIRNGGFRRRLEGRPAPSASDEAMLYQTLVGHWPLRLEPDDAEGVGLFGERVAQWQRKSLREAKLRSNWDAPEVEYEKACDDFLIDILRSPFAADCARFVARIAAAGALNGLSQTVLRLTAPGVPDCFQGAEFWDFSLVDPDNRSPVDWNSRIGRLAETSRWSDLLPAWRDGRIKQRVVATLLRLRADMPELFAEGDYRPLAVSGRHTERLIAFSRHAAGRGLAVVVPRLVHPLLGGTLEPMVPSAQWGDTAVDLRAGHGWRDCFAESGPTAPAMTFMSALAAEFPLAVLVSE